MYKGGHFGQKIKVNFVREKGPQLRIEQNESRASPPPNVNSSLNTVLTKGGETSPLRPPIRKDEHGITVDQYYHYKKYGEIRYLSQEAPRNVPRSPIYNVSNVFADDKMSHLKDQGQSEIFESFSNRKGGAAGMDEVNLGRVVNSSQEKRTRGPHQQNTQRTVTAPSGARRTRLVQPKTPKNVKKAVGPEDNFSGLQSVKSGKSNVSKGSSMKTHGWFTGFMPGPPIRYSKNSQITKRQQQSQRTQDFFKTRQRPKFNETMKVDDSYIQFFPDVNGSLSQSARPKDGLNQTISYNFNESPLIPGAKLFKTPE